MIKNIKSVNGTHHIGLYNFRNSYCHYTSVIQRLHSSPTLTRELLKSSSANEIGSNINDPDLKSFVSTIMYPVYIYATYDPSVSNDGAIYESLRTYFSEFETHYVAEHGRNGYLPQYVMTTIFLPIVHKLFPDKFDLILRELTMDVIDFVNIESSVQSIICSDDQAFFHQKYRQMLYNMYTEMMNDIPKQINRNAFCSAVLEVFPNKAGTGGHAITLIKCDDDKYFIIDDQNRVSSMEDYFRERKTRLHHISIRDIDEETIANINAILHAKCKIDPSCAFNARVTRYELNMEHNFLAIEEATLLKDEYKEETPEGHMDETVPLKETEIVQTNIKDIPEMRGGNTQTGGDFWDFFAGALLFSWFGPSRKRASIIGIVIVVLILIFIIVCIVMSAKSSKTTTTTNNDTSTTKTNNERVFNESNFSNPQPIPQSTTPNRTPEVTMLGGGGSQGTSNPVNAPPPSQDTVKVEAPAKLGMPEPIDTPTPTSTEPTGFVENPEDMDALTPTREGFVRYIC